MLFRSYMRVINNLIQNAVSHSHCDKIEITLSKKNHHMEIVLADNGIGIKNEDQEHIFERLYQCGQAGPDQGSGLGLSIVHQLVEKMDGTITAKSPKENGTAFTLLFPLAG